MRVVNALEAEALSGVAVEGLGGAEAAARALSEAWPVAVVTAGGDGVAIAERGGGSFVRSAEKVALVSTHGAGAVFAGTMAAALLGGASLSGAVDLASRAAARHVAGSE